MSTLYRKYRPKLWSEVFGQESIKNTLKNEILNNKLAHAYIFAGSRGIGKTTTARLFAKTLNCTNRKPGDIEPCGVCDSCLAIDNGSSMELIEIDAASNTGVDDVRELRKLTRIPPKIGAYKIFIIDEVHMLSKQAFNALLKTLEEPPERVIFILATTEINKILDTILSRCQIFKFKKATNDEIISDLKLICEREGISVSDDVLLRVAEKATGGFRDAESLLGQILSSLNQKTIGEDDIRDIINKTSQDYILSFVIGILNKDIKSCFNIISDVVESQSNFDDFILDLIEIFRKILIYKYNPDCIDNWKNLDDDIKNNIINTSKEIEFSRLSIILNKLIKVKLDIKNSDITQLPLEIAVVEMCEDENQKTKTKNQNIEIQNISQKLEINKHLLKTTENKDVSVLDILDDNEPKPSLSEVVQKNGLLNHVDPSKREQMMKRFGLIKDGNGGSNTQNTKEEEKVLVKSNNEVQQEDVSVFDILKDEFADNLE